MKRKKGSVNEIWHFYVFFNHPRLSSRPHTFFLFPFLRIIGILQERKSSFPLSPCLDFLDDSQEPKPTGAGGFV